MRLPMGTSPPAFFVFIYFIRHCQVEHKSVQEFEWNCKKYRKFAFLYNFPKLRAFCLKLIGFFILLIFEKKLIQVLPWTITQCTTHTRQGLRTVSRRGKVFCLFILYLWTQHQNIHPYCLCTFSGPRRARGGCRRGKWDLCRRGFPKCWALESPTEFWRPVFSDHWTDSTLRQ